MAASRQVYAKPGRRQAGDLDHSPASFEHGGCCYGRETALAPGLGQQESHEARGPQSCRE